MIDSDIRPALCENFKEIEDIIDARKRLGQYNVYKHPILNIKRCGTNDSIKNTKFEEASMISFEQPGCSNSCGNVKCTDSEITVVRVKCDGLIFKKKQNKWDMHDIAIPGDGSHLGESPSLVNLATLVAQNVQCDGDEYLVPLSSWDPFIKSDEVQSDMKCCSDSKVLENEKYCDSCNNSEENTSKTDEVHGIYRRASWAGKISKFLRKHCNKKSKTQPQE